MNIINPQPTVFTVSQSDLLASLKTAQKTPLPPGYCEKNGLQLIFSCIVFTLQEDTLLVQATDRLTAIRIAVPVTVQQTSGKEYTFAVYARDFTYAVRCLGKQDLTLCIQGGKLKVTHSFGSFSMMLYAGHMDQFQAHLDALCSCECTHTLQLESAYLRSVLQRSSFAMAKGDLRPVLNGLYIGTGGNKLDFVASDGIVLVRIQKDMQDLPMSKIIVPERCVKVMRHIIPSAGTTAIHYKPAPENTEKPNDGIVHIDTGIGIDFWFTPVQGKYPNFLKVIPESFVSTATVNRKELIQTIDRMNLFVGVSKGGRFQIKPDFLHLKVEDPDFGMEAEEQLPSVAQGTGLTFGLQFNNLMNILRNIHTASVTIQGTNPTQAFVIAPHPMPETERTTMLIMPMAIND